jgi:hypothetical protein
MIPTIAFTNTNNNKVPVVREVLLCCEPRAVAETGGELVATRPNPTSAATGSDEATEGISS